MITIVLLTSVLAAAASARVLRQRKPIDRQENFELLILHDNDMHARFEETSQLSGTCTATDENEGKCYGGFARVAYVVKEARRAAAEGRGPPVLYLNAGDTYTGTVFFTLYKWKIAAELINALHPDAVALGNHEFDNDVSGLTPFIENLTCPVLAANLILTAEPELQSQQKLMNSVIFNINGVQVGVIGYLTPETKISTLPNNVEYIEEVEAISRQVAKLKKEGVNIFIALGHSGFIKDLQIAEEVEDIDLVIGGHSHTFLYNGKKPDVEEPVGLYPTIIQQPAGKLVPVVQAYAYTKYLGKLHIVFNSDGEMINFYGNPILLDKSVPQDGDILNIINRYRDEALKLSQVLVGYTSVLLDGHTCRLKECNLGNLVTDAVIYKYASEYKGEGWSDAPIAIINGGSIRTSIANRNVLSKVTLGDLLAVFPFDGNIVKATINGSTLLDMLEHSVKNYKVIRAQGGFLQLSGIIVEYDFGRHPGTRVVKVLVRCGKCEIPKFSPFNKTSLYNILLPSFLYFGGDGFSMFHGSTFTPQECAVLQIMKEYIQSHSPVYPGIENRIVIHNLDKLQDNSMLHTIRITFHQMNI